MSHWERITKESSASCSKQRRLRIDFLTLRKATLRRQNSTWRRMPICTRNETQSRILYFLLTQSTRVSDFNLRIWSSTLRQETAKLSASREQYSWKKQRTTSKWLKKTLPSSSWGPRWKCTHHKLTREYIREEALKMAAMTKSGGQFMRQVLWLTTAKHQSTFQKLKLNEVSTISDTFSKPYTTRQRIASHSITRFQENI